MDDDPAATASDLRRHIDTIEERLDRLNKEAKPLREKMSLNDRERAKLQAEKKELEARLSTLRDSIIVSDHAVVRYLERRYGFDFEAVRSEILTPAVRAAVNAGAAGIKVEGGTFKIQDRTITTFFTGSEDRKR